MANVIAACGRPTLILEPNKTLAAQIAAELREFFPENAVEFFVSYYDYYQPEAYIPGQDMYIEKDAMINDEIDQLRHSATSSLFERRDVIIVSSVSCIYSLGDPSEYSKMVLSLRPGMIMDRNDFIRKLPDNVSLKQAAMIEPVCISMHAVNMCGVNENSTVLVTGGGAIGLFAAAAAKAKGAKYVALTEANPGRIKIAEEADFVDEVFDAADPEINEKVKAKAPEGFDISVECSGHPAAANLALYSLKRGGQHAILAYGPGFKYDAMAIINNELHIHGSVMFTVPEFEDVIKLMSEGKIDVEKYGELVAMEDAQEIFEGLDNGSRPAVKYIYDMSK
jgi:hypothetical protein